MEKEREPQDEKSEESTENPSQDNGERLPDPNMVDLTEEEDSSEVSPAGAQGSGDSQEQLPPPNVATKGKDPEGEEREG